MKTITFGSKKLNEFHVEKSQISIPIHIVVIVEREGKSWQHKREMTYCVPENNKINSRLLARSTRGQRQWSDIFSAQGTKLSTKNSVDISSKSILHKWSKIKTFPNKKVFASRLDLQEILKTIFQAESGTKWKSPGGNEEC